MKKIIIPVCILMTIASVWGCSDDSSGSSVTKDTEIQTVPKCDNDNKNVVHCKNDECQVVDQCQYGLQ